LSNGISVSISSRPISMYVDKPLVHVLGQIGNQFGTAVEPPPAFHVNPNQETPEDKETPQALTLHASCWELANNTQYKLRMGRVGTREDFLVLPATSLYQHWQAPSSSGDQAPSEKSEKPEKSEKSENYDSSELIDIWIDGTERALSTRFNFDARASPTLVPLHFWLNEDPAGPNDPGRIFAVLHVTKQGLKTKLSVEGTYKIVNLLDIPLKVDLGRSEEGLPVGGDKRKRESFGSVVVYPRSAQIFAVPLSGPENESVDPPEVGGPNGTEVIEVSPPSVIPPNELLVTFPPSEHTKVFAQTVPLPPSASGGTQLVINEDHVIGMTVDHVTTGSSNTVVLTFNNILKIRNLTPFVISCRPSFFSQLSFKHPKEGSGVSIATNEERAVRVCGMHEGIQFFVGENNGTPISGASWSSEIVPIPYDLDLSETPEQSPVTVTHVTTGGFKLHVASRFDFGQRQIVLEVYLPFYFYNLTTKTVLLKPEKNPVQASSLLPGEVPSDSFVVPTGTFQTPPESWDAWILSKDEKFLALGVPSAMVEGDVSWSFPFSTAKSLQTLASIKTRPHIYSRFSLVIQKTDYSTVITIRPRVVLVNRTKKLLHVDNTHYLSSASGSETPSSTSLSPAPSLGAFTKPSSSFPSTPRLSTEPYGVLVEPNEQISLNEWRVKSISELWCMIRVSICESPEEARQRHQWSSEIDLSHATELNHVAVPKISQLTPVILKYSIVENEGVLYAILLPTPNPPLTIVNHTDQIFVYTLGTTNKASLIPPKSSVECFWEADNPELSSGFSARSLKERNVLTMKSPNRLIKFGKLGGLEWSPWFNTREIGAHELPFLEARGRQAPKTDQPVLQAHSGVLRLDCSSSGGCSILNIVDSSMTAPSSRPDPALISRNPGPSPSSSSDLLLSPRIQIEAPAPAQIFPAPGEKQVATLKNFSLTINVSQINVSVLDDEFRELLHVAVDEISVFFGMFFDKENPFRLARECFHFESAVQEIQIDSHLPEVEFPVILCRVSPNSDPAATPDSSPATSVPPPFLKTLAIFATNSDRTLIHVDHVELVVVPVAVNVDDQLITKGTEIVEIYAEILTSTEEKNNPVPGDLGLAPNALFLPSIKFPDSLLDILEGSEFYINYMYLGAVHVDFTLHAGVGVYLGLGSTPIDLSPVVVQDIECLPHHVGQALVQRYVLDLLNSSPAMLGSLDVLGNPTLLWHDVVAGVSDFFSIPVRYALGLGVFFWGVGTSRSFRFFSLLP
jgi:hypothetical protein